MANQRVYQILVYRYELLKINFTGVPSSSPPAFPRFFPALSLALFFGRAPLSERLEQASLTALALNEILWRDKSHVKVHYYWRTKANRRGVWVL